MSRKKLNNSHPTPPPTEHQQNKQKTVSFLCLLISISKYLYGGYNVPSSVPVLYYFNFEITSSLFPAPISTSLYQQVLVIKI